MYVPLGNYVFFFTIMIIKVPRYLFNLLTVSNYNVILLLLF